ncbi:TspO/MBR family protein [Nitratireductor sp. XY-223]|uniref:TspO/MBR family protein n=1 Tax=Nitratireductor sp. XY-223 TaxID=2561926 RepID=UPI0010AA6F45|nr:TspO/MBR family protein [Nitratireductor sp. XY-223]
MSLIVFLVLVAAAAWTGSRYKPGAWYEQLQKPAWTPPNWLFPIAWSVLYLMMAISGWLVWGAGGWTAALLFWALQLVFNAAWSWLFFGRRLIHVALADIVLLWLAIMAFIMLSWPVSQAAALLFLPYLLWVSFAGLLNWRITRMNDT